MLDIVTKRRIDSARDTLVGKVPDPKSQVEQITIALIYKFMDDMDAEAEEFGGKRQFFAGEFAKYGWAQIMNPRIGGHERLGLYAEGISRMVENPGIPSLFRDMFKNAYLPYRDPETLTAFLKIINDFTYDHSERLGDAFEYLLSVLGSQGDAGQFRTPRHIIDFMVEVMDPKKGEMILDPACGTAGFLISAYKHIRRANSDREGQSTLTPDEKERLAANFKGYDISPDMVRLSLVNMYLHGFSDPHIFEYDTLTSEERWGEHADVILANPPFMSPKGGIKPHKRFSIPAKRSEVLFVDYMAEHLTAQGRAAIVVPEGIVFQNQGAYRELRRMLVEQSLVAVVSLPGGCFQPYSGVKTCILILDKSIARRCDSIAFFKVENDGFGLGAQRRAIDMNDLPVVLTELKNFLAVASERADFEMLALTRGHIVSKKRIASRGDFALGGDRYVDAVASTTSYPLLPVGDFIKGGVRTVDPRVTPDEMFELWSIPAFDAGAPELLLGSQIGSQKKVVAPGDVLLSRIIPHIRRGWVVQENFAGLRQVASTEWIVFSHDSVLPEYLREVVISDRFHASFMQTITGVGGSLSRANVQSVGDIEIPVPPTDVQREIVKQIVGFRRIIDGARDMVTNYRPALLMDSAWDIEKLGDVCAAILTGPFGTALHQSDYVADGIPVLNPQNIVGGAISTDGVKMVSPQTRDRLEEFTLRENDILIGRRGEMGRCAVVTAEMTGWLCGTGCFVIRLDSRCVARFIQLQISSEKSREYLDQHAVGVTMKNLNQSILASLEVALPPPETQRALVEEIEREESLIRGSSELIDRFEKKIQMTLSRIWGQETSSDDDDRTYSSVAAKVS